MGIIIILSLGKYFSLAMTFNVAVIHYDVVNSKNQDKEHFMALFKVTKKTRRFLFVCFFFANLWQLKQNKYLIFLYSSCEGKVTLAMVSP